MFQAPRGTRDILPAESPAWRHLESEALAMAARFGYQEIRTPTFEDAALFLRGVGEGTDIVDKEIYRFLDKGGADVALRPEATAAVMRAYLQHGMGSLPQPVRLSSILTVFRYDRPQAGRYREFRQFNIEAIGDPDPLVDAEVIAILWRYLEGLGLRGLKILLNSIGDGTDRPHFIAALVAHYGARRDLICHDCQRRLETNPLRLLDCKNSRCQESIATAPRTLDYLSAENERHFSMLRRYLDGMELHYEITPTLVRGLDYYTRTVFEVVPPSVGAQSTIGGGGRYDGLAEQVGGKPTPGVGFATGLDRILLNLREQALWLPEEDTVYVFFAAMGDAAKAEAAIQADRARRAGLRVMVGTGDRGMKARMRQADASQARLAVIIGDDELASQQATVRDLSSRAQEQIPLNGLVERLVATKGEGLA
ncbi:MAG: histidine--tRNA ligase [Chloroflexota bacterium]